MPPRAAAKPAAKKKPAAHKLPDPIREGEILRDITKRQWRLGRSIGVGGFGEIYAASDNIDKPTNTAEADYVIKIEPHANGPLFVEMNFYIRAAKAELIDEWMRQHKLRFLGMPRFIGSGSHEYKGEKYRFMVMQRFGTDVQKLFEANGKRLPVQTVMNLALRIIDVLEYIHDKQYVHADIKGANLLLGHGTKGQAEHQVWLVDFGLACRYTNGGVHKEYKADPRKAHNGTIEFTSRDAHIGAPSRRGDMEILAYNVVQWLCGRLPWESNLQDAEFVAGQKNKFMADVPLFVQTCFPAKNGTKPPGVVARFLDAVARLKFDEKPDYDKFRALCRQGLKEAGHADDGRLVFSNNATAAPSARSTSTPVGRGGKKSADVPSIVVDDVEPQSRKPRGRVGSPAPQKPSKRSAVTVASSSDTSLEAVPKQQTPKKKRPEASGRAASSASTAAGRRAPSSAKLDDSMSNPTPAMMAIMARMRTREESSPARKRPTRKSESPPCPSSPSVADPCDDDVSLILTPAMEDVLRVREIRKSMEVSGHFFTPSCSPTDAEEDEEDEAGARRQTVHITESTAEEDDDDDDDDDDEDFQEEPVRRKTRAPAAAPATSTSRAARRRTPLVLDSSAEAAASPGDTSETPERRVIQKRKYRVVSVTSAATQTTPGLFQWPASGARTPYSLRAGVRTARQTPPVVDLAISPDIFQNH